MNKDFYGRDIIELKLKDGNLAKMGDVIRWHCYDGEENTVWTFMGIYQSNKVIYLGGGIDFGEGIGKEMTVDEVINESEENDSSEQGIDKVCSVSDLVQHIRNINI